MNEHEEFLQSARELLESKADIQTKENYLIEVYYSKHDQDEIEGVVNKIEKKCSPPKKQELQRFLKKYRGEEGGLEIQDILDFEDLKLIHRNSLFD